MTALDIIKRAMRICGVIGQNETPTSSEATDGLVALNDMLDSWSTDRTYIFSLLQTNFPLVDGTVTYTIGTGGTFNTDRPIAIDNVFVRTSSTDFPLKEINSQDYNSITSKSSNGGIPQYYFFNPSFPLATISLWGAPQSGLTIYFNTWQSLSQFANLTTDYTFPQGYARALAYGLAVELSAEYGVRLMPETIGISVAAQANIRNKNLPEPVMKTEVGLIGGGIYNYLSDGYA
jgi:hypothetical protein